MINRDVGSAFVCINSVAYYCLWFHKEDIVFLQKINCLLNKEDMCHLAHPLAYLLSLEILKLIFWFLLVEQVPINCFGDINLRMPYF